MSPGSSVFFDSLELFATFRLESDRFRSRLLLDFFIPLEEADLFTVGLFLSSAESLDVVEFLLWADEPFCFVLEGADVVCCWPIASTAGG